MVISLFEKDGEIYTRFRISLKSFSGMGTVY